VRIWCARVACCPVTLPAVRYRASRAGCGSAPSSLARYRARLLNVLVASRLHSSRRPAPVQRPPTPLTRIAVCNGEHLVRACCLTALPTKLATVAPRTTMLESAPCYLARCRAPLLRTQDASRRSLVWRKRARRQLPARVGASPSLVTEPRCTRALATVRHRPPSPRSSVCGAFYCTPCLA
jgi:hypothetical protein